MVALERSTPYTPWTAGRANSYATEIERLATGLFGSLTNTTRPLTVVRRTSNLAVLNNTPLVITWQTASKDSAQLPMWDPGTPSVLTVRTAGQYLLLGQVLWDVGSTGIRASALLKNATTDAGSIGDNAVPAISGAFLSTATIGVEQLVAGDLIRLDGYQTNGANLNMLTTKGGTRLAALWLGP